jgi:hypothetical protein
MNQTFEVEQEMIDNLRAFVAEGGRYAAHARRILALLGYVDPSEAEDEQRIAKAFGERTGPRGIRTEGTALVLGILTPAQAAAHLRMLEEARNGR